MGRQIVDAVRLIAAPRQMAGPHFAARPLRFAVGCDEHPRAFMAGFAVATFACHGTGRHSSGTRLLFERPTTGELRERVCTTGHRHSRFQPIDGQWPVFAVFAAIRTVDITDGLFDHRKSALFQRKLEIETYFVHAIFRSDGDCRRLGFAIFRGKECGHGSPAHEHRASATVGFKPRTAGERFGALWQQRWTQGRVGLFVRRGDSQRHGVKLGQCGFVGRKAEVSTPVFDLRHFVGRGLQHDAHAISAQHGMGSLIKHRCLLRVWKMQARHTCPAFQAFDF